MYPRPWLGLFAVVSLLALSVPAAAAAAVLLRLWAREIDPNIKSRVLQEMRSSAPRYARLLLAGGDDATAAQLLEATALFQGGPAVVDYAAYLAARGQLKRSITEWT